MLGLALEAVEGMKGLNRRGWCRRPGFSDTSWEKADKNMLHGEYSCQALRENQDGSLPMLTYSAEDKGEETFMGLIFRNWLQREGAVTKRSLEPR